MHSNTNQLPIFGSYLLKEWWNFSSPHKMIWQHQHLKQRFFIIKDFYADITTHPRENTSNTHKTCHRANMSRTEFCSIWNKQNSSRGNDKEEYTSSPKELPEQCSHYWFSTPLPWVLVVLKVLIQVSLPCVLVRLFIYSLKIHHKILLWQRQKFDTSIFP